jgi:integrase/recombinase XerD
VSGRAAPSRTAAERRQLAQDLPPCPAVDADAIARFLDGFWAEAGV